MSTIVGTKLPQNKRAVHHNEDCGMLNSKGHNGKVIELPEWLAVIVRANLPACGRCKGGN